MGVRSRQERVQCCKIPERAIEDGDKFMFSRSGEFFKPRLKNDEARAILPYDYVTETVWRKVF